MAKENKKLKKLAHDEMQNISGGRIFVSTEAGPSGGIIYTYFVVVPNEKGIYEFSSKDAAVAFSRQNRIQVSVEGEGEYYSRNDAISRANAYMNNYINTHPDNPHYLWHATNMAGFLSDLN